LSDYFRNLLPLETQCFGSQADLSSITKSKERSKKDFHPFLINIQTLTEITIFS
jgi:hypothetical protein